MGRQTSVSWHQYHQSKNIRNTADNVSTTTQHLIGDGSPDEFHGLTISYVTRFFLAHIRYGIIIFVFTSYPLWARKRYVKWRKKWRAVMGENCTLFDFDRLDGGFRSRCHSSAWRSLYFPPYLGNRFNNRRSINLGKQDIHFWRYRINVYTYRHLVSYVNCD